MKFAMYLRTRPPSKEKVLLQRAEIERWASEERAEVVAVYEEQEEFGERGRPERARMLLDAAASPRPFDAIVMTSWSRLTRDVNELSRIESVLEALGIQLIALHGRPGLEELRRIAGVVSTAWLGRSDRI